MRDMLSKMNLEAQIEEIFPFTADYSHNLVTILNDEDLKGTDFWSDKTLSERYHEAKGT